MKKVVHVDKDAMAHGYMEMSDLNLEISNCYFATEEEGWRLSYEMETTKMGDNA